MKSKFNFEVLLLSLFFSVCEKTNAQSPDWLWAKAMGGVSNDGITSTAVDPGSGDVYTTGSFKETVDFDPGTGLFNLSGPGAFISKLDGSGNFVWARSIGGIVAISSIALKPAGNGDVYTTGWFKGTVDFDPGAGSFNLTSTDCQGNPYCGDIFISKLDGLGNFVWAVAMGGIQYDGSNSIAVDHAGSGDVYITGEFNGTVDFDPGSGTFNLTSVGQMYNPDIFISKLDGEGNFLWARAMVGTDHKDVNSIAVDHAGSGDVYTTGNFQGTVDFDPGVGTFNLSSAGVKDIFISKLDSSGDFVWAKAIGGINYDVGSSIVVDLAGSGDIYTTGYFEGTVDFDPGVGTFNLISAGNGDIFISKLDGSGNFVWSKAIGGINYDVGSSIALDPSGSKDVYTTGSFRETVDFDPGAGTFNLSSAGFKDIFISKIDYAGNFVWAKAIGGINNDHVTSIALDALGHVHVAGYFYSPSISFDFNTLTNADSTGTSSDILIANLDFLTSVDLIHAKTQKLTIYPNPATTELTIEFGEGEFLNIGIIIFNILGEVVYSNPPENISHQKNINTSSLSTGIYFIELNVDGNRVMEKVVKE